MIGACYDCRLNGGDTQRWLGHPKPTCCNKIYLNFWHSEAVGMQKKPISIVPTGALKLARTCSAIFDFNHIIFYSFQDLANNI